MPLGDMIGLLRGLWSRESAYAGPFAVTIDFTSRCNLRCAGCGFHSPLLEGTSAELARGDLDRDLFAGLCRELQTMGTRRLVFCGQGEPLLHPELLDLIRLAKGAGLQTTLITNGTLLTEEKIHGLIDCRLDQIRVSLWATSPEEYAANYPGSNPRLFQAMLGGLALLGSIGRARASALRVTLHTVLDRFNWRRVDAFVDLALEARVTALSFSPLHSQFGRLRDLALAAVEEQELKDSLRRAQSRLLPSGVQHNIEETIHRYEIGEAVRGKVPCYIAWTHPRVRGDGTVHPCGPCQRPMGNLREQSLREIWNGPAYRAFRKRLLDPHETELFESCDCSFCCHVTDNSRIHRVYKWIAPVGRLLES
jgi:MoaA/NifB/PqqE/SkfB family radical SAM enzyme